MIHQTRTYEHHRYADLFPMLEPDDLKAMAKDMEERGYDPSEPIVLHEGKILDGRNRFAAAFIAGIEDVPTIEFAGPDPLAFVVQKNIHRRHLTVSQRAMVAAEIANMSLGDNQHKKRVGNIADPRKHDVSREKAAEMMDVSERTVRDAAKVRDKGHPALRESVQAGKVTVSDAAKVADQPPEVQRRAVDAVKSGKAKTVAAAVDEGGFPAESPPEPSSTPMGVDGWGIPIQPHAAEAFANLPEFDELIRLLRRADKLYSQLAELPGGKRLTKWGVSENTRNRWKSKHIESAIKAVQDCKPKYTVCPYKHNPHQPHDDKNCTLCYGFGWLPEVGKDRVPADLIANAKAAYGVDDDV